MKNFINNSTMIAFLVTVLSSCGMKHEAKLYQKKTQILSLEYGPEDCYSRSISAYGDQLYIAGSDGYAYAYDLQKSIGRNLNILPYAELRDIHAFDSHLIMASQASDTSVIMFIRDGNESTHQIQEGPAFWDALDFNKRGRGLVVGDPVDELFMVYTTDDRGDEWIKRLNGLTAEEGEACFAASGSIVQMLNDTTMVFVSGGSTSRLYRSSDFGFTWKSWPIPFNPGEGSGAFSVHFWDLQNGIVVGGNYLDPSNSDNNCFITSDGGRTWTKPEIPPRGYRSHVIIALNVMYACGTTGIDFSLDMGKTWFPLSDSNTFALAYYKEYIYATTTKGKILFFKAFLNKKS